MPRGNALGLTISLPDQDTLHTTRNEMRDRIVVLLGGRVAEQLEFDDISTGASNDLQRATKLAHDMIAKYGMNERIGAVPMTTTARSSSAATMSARVPIPSRRLPRSTPRSARLWIRLMRTARRS